MRWFAHETDPMQEVKKFAHDTDPVH